MRPKIKICGLTRPQDVAAAIEHGADYMGFIVEAKSARRLSVTDAAQVARPARGLVPTVAVTVNADNALIESICSVMKPDYIQLHGDETPERAADIRARYDARIIKALPVSKPHDLVAISKYDVDIILLDAKPPKGAARGGHGVAFDWSMLKNADLPDMWMLAGGINLGTAQRAIAMTQAPILDISSGVESAPGVKDHTKLKALFEGIRS